MIRAKVLVWKGVVEDSDFLSDPYEANRPRRNKHLGLKSAIGRHDLKLEALWVRGFTNGCLQRRDATGDWRSDNVGAATVDFREALICRCKLVAQRLDLLRHESRKLLQ